MRRQRKSARISFALNPVVRRAFYRWTRQRGHTCAQTANGIIERLLVCLLRSDLYARHEIIEAGYLPVGECAENAIERRARLANLAERMVARRAGYGGLTLDDDRAFAVVGTGGKIWRLFICDDDGGTGVVVDDFKRHIVMSRFATIGDLRDAFAEVPADGKGR